MILLGITGAIGHGKTTLAEALLQAEPDAVHLETGMIVAEVADELHKNLEEIPSPDDLAAINDWLSCLPETLAQVTHKTCSISDLRLVSAEIASNPSLYEKLFTHLGNLKASPELANQSITTANKAQYRAFLQWLGGYLVKKVDTGIWYDELINRLNNTDKQLGIISGVRFPSDGETIHNAGGLIVGITRPEMAETDAQDPTERERSMIQPDCIVINNAGVDQLALCAQKILNDIRAKALQKQYLASKFV